MITFTYVTSQTICDNCFKHAVTGRHYAFYPYRMTEGHDTGDYLETYLCKDCLKMMKERNRLADSFLTKEDLRFIKQYKIDNAKRVKVKRRA